MVVDGREAGAVSKNPYNMAVFCKLEPIHQRNGTSYLLFGGWYVLLYRQYSYWCPGSIFFVRNAQTRY